MTLLQTIIISIVEGLTEFLPVSSTGHMIITQNLLGVPQGNEFVHAFTFIIQFGAILSVVCLYWKRFFKLESNPVIAENSLFGKFIKKYWWYWGVLTGFVGGCIAGYSLIKGVFLTGLLTAAIVALAVVVLGFVLRIFIERLQFYWLLVVGVIPAVIVGLLAKKSGLLDWLLDSVWVVAVTLVLGGIFMLFCDKIFNKGADENIVNEKRAFHIGMFQCLSVIPGMSRSMSTIVGGMACGLTRRRAAEFSFFLAVPTMAGATLLDLIDLLRGDSSWATSDNLTMLAVGCVVSFIVALLAMKWFVDFLAKYGFKAFGWYRIIVGGIILAMLLSGVSLNMVD